MDLSCWAAKMMPPWPLRVSTNEVQWGAEVVCLKEARDVPVCMSWRTIAPEPEAGTVAHRMISCRSISEHERAVVRN